MKTTISTAPLNPTNLKILNTGENDFQQEERPDKIENSKPLNKEQVEKQLAIEGEDDLLDTAYDPEEDPTPIVIFDTELNSIKELKAVDIVFLLDSTASMSPYFKGVKRCIRKIIWDAQRCLTQFVLEEIDILKVGLVSYKDHDQTSQFVSKIHSNLTTDFKKFTQILMKIKASGGSDEPEAVVDGLNDAINNIEWREKSYKFLYHILDAPPHGEVFYKFDDESISNSEEDGKKYDNYVEFCPCQLNYEEILINLRIKDINYTIIKLGDKLDKMIEEYEKLVKIEVLTPDIKYDISKLVNQED